MKKIMMVLLASWAIASFSLAASYQNEVILNPGDNLDIKIEVAPCPSGPCPQPDQTNVKAGICVTCHETKKVKADYWTTDSVTGLPGLGPHTRGHQKHLGRKIGGYYISCKNCHNY